MPGTTELRPKRAWGNYNPAVVATWPPLLQKGHLAYKPPARFRASTCWLRASTPATNLPDSRAGGAGVGELVGVGAAFAARAAVRVGWGWPGARAGWLWLGPGPSAPAPACPHRGLGSAIGVAGGFAGLPGIAGSGPGLPPAAALALGRRPAIAGARRGPDFGPGKVSSEFHQSFITRNFLSKCIPARPVQCFAEFHQSFITRVSSKFHQSLSTRFHSRKLAGGSPAGARKRTRVRKPKKTNRIAEILNCR